MTIYSRQTKFVIFLVLLKSIYIIPHISTQYDRCDCTIAQYSFNIVTLFKDFLTFFKIARLLYTLFFTSVVCGFQLNSASICTPRNFVTYTLSILNSLIVTWQSLLENFFPKTIKFVFVTFSDNLFKANQVCNFFSSVEINLQVSSKLFPVQNILVSSANMMKFNNLEILQMSLIYKINN